MKKPFGKMMKVWALGALGIVVGGTFFSCSDEIAESNRFTFTGELIADHLQKHPEKYENFCKILRQAKISNNASDILTTLSTYGSYTCFAPTNEAIERYLEQKYTEYIESVEANKLDPSVKIRNTGITSPNLEDLSDSMATVIAKNHLIEEAFSTIAVNKGALPKKTMSRRTVDIDWKKDDQGYSYPTLNTIKVLEKDIETENGYIHCIDGAFSPSDQPTSTLLSTQPGFKLFSDALRETGFDDYLTKFELDPNYVGLGQYGIPFITQNKQEPPYPESKNQGFTLLVETDSLLADPSNNSLGLSIQSIEDLEWFAANYYIDIKKDGYIVKDEGKRDFGYINDKGEAISYKGKYTDPLNPLYKFIAYHIIDRKLLYSSSRGPGGFIMENYYKTATSDDGTESIDPNNFDSEENMPKDFDRYDYFETALNTPIKVTKPFSNQVTTYTRINGQSGMLRDEIVINYAQEMGERCLDPKMRHHINVVVEDQSTARSRPGLNDFISEAVNGYIYTIDKILVYDETEMAGNILDERMRWDVFSLFPELTSNDVRWVPIDNYTLVYIPENYSSRLKHNNTDTHIYYLRPYNTGLGTTGGGYANYQGDEMLVTGKYDFEYRIPFLPKGKYEIRFGFSASDARGVAQFYFDGNICGIPLDMRSQNSAFMGWFEESMSDEDNRKNDKAMRNRGFMKAPASIFGDGGGEIGIKNMRYAESAFRRVLGQYDIEPGKEYWLRFKDVTEGGSEDKPNEFNQDYLEIVPVGIINNPGKPEDIY